MTAAGPARTPLLRLLPHHRADLARSGLEQEGFTVYFHRQTPPNDGGLALGQILAATRGKEEN